MIERSCNPCSARPAFTLVELLTVIVIILILAGLTAVGVSHVVANQRIANTETAMRTIQKVLNEHWATVVSDAKNETGVPFGNIDRVFGPDNTGGERDRIMWIKMRLMEAFPVSYGDIANPFPYRTGIIPANLRKYNASYQHALAMRKQLNPSIPHLGITESSACLMIALSITRNGTALNRDNMGSINVADTDLDNIPEFVDSWGNPLLFYRFPAGNAALQATSPGGVRYADPLDPNGVLFQWHPPPPPPGHSPRSDFELNVHKIAFNPQVACYVVPTIVSWGPNGNIHKTGATGAPAPYGWGLNADMSVADGVAEADNIYSFTLR